MREPHREKLLLKGLGVAQKKLNRNKYKCLLPSCKRNSIKSHSQQKKHQLEAISESLKVYAIEKDIYKTFKEKNNNKELLREKPIGESSTYPGYCNEHDTSIFLPIENGNLDVTLPEHNLLLFLRCVSHEFSNKRSAYDRANYILEENYELFGVGGRSYYRKHIEGMKQYLELDAPLYLTKIFEAYETKDYSKISFNSFTVQKNLGVSSSTMFSALRENYYEWIAENADSAQPSISFNLIPDNDKTSISFVWLSEHDNLCEQIFNISSNDSDFLKVINMYAFTESEDTCINPSLWESITEQDKKEIYKHFAKKDTIEGAINIPQIISI